MKLFMSPGACSLASHIALVATGLPFSTEKVNLRSKQTASGEDYRAINPKGYVPALQLDNGHVLTEGGSILLYLADLVPAAGLAPAAGTLERAVLTEWLFYLSTEVHKRFSPLFKPGTAPEEREAAWAALAGPLGYVAGKVDGTRFLLGEQFSVADGYLFAMLGWVKVAGFSLDAWPALQAYQARVAEVPVVRTALQNEGLL